MSHGTYRESTPTAHANQVRHFFLVDLKLLSLEGGGYCTVGTHMHMTASPESPHRVYTAPTHLLALAALHIGPKGAGRDQGESEKLYFHTSINYS
jgi:hypothetical protein